MLQRNFNLVGYTPKSIEKAQQELCIFSPALGNIQEVCLILNPIYNKVIDAAIEVLVRADFKILQYQKRRLTELQATDLVGFKFSFEDGQHLVCLDLPTGKTAEEGLAPALSAIAQETVSV